MKWPVKGRYRICEQLKKIPQLQGPPAWAAFFFAFLSSPLFEPEYFVHHWSWKIVSWKETILPLPKQCQIRFGSAAECSVLEEQIQASPSLLYNIYISHNIQERPTRNFQKDLTSMYTG